MTLPKHNYTHDRGERAEDAVDDDIRRSGRFRLQADQWRDLRYGADREVRDGLGEWGHGVASTRLCWRQRLVSRSSRWPLTEKEDLDCRRRRTHPDTKVLTKLMKKSSISRHRSHLVTLPFFTREIGNH